MCFWSKSSADILCWYVGKFWSHGHYSLTRHLREGWSSESTRKLDSGCGSGPGMVVGMAEGGWVRRDLEHVYVGWMKFEDAKNASLNWSYIDKRMSKKGN